MSDDSAEEVDISKGSYLPVHRFANSAGEDDEFILIPSWVTGGLFYFEGDDEILKMNGPNNAPQKRQKVNHESESFDESTRPYSNLEQLVTHEIRNCDVCGCHVLWTKAMHQSCFGLKERDNSMPSKSIAESLPQFLGKHFMNQSALPCGFCIRAHTSKTFDGSYSWCGTLYCSDECRNKVESDSNRTPILSTKLFFCRNRIIHKFNSGNNDVEVLEVLDSLSAIKERLLSLCGANNCRSKESSMQVIGREECALLISTLICCSSLWQGEYLLQLLKNIDNEKADLETSENDIVEEIWVMIRSYCSLIQAMKSLKTKIRHSNGELPSYIEFAQLYTAIKRHYIFRVGPPSHPLLSYATKTLLESKELKDGDRKSALDNLHVVIEEIAKDSCCDKTGFCNQSAITIWRRATHFSHWISTSSPDQHIGIQEKVSFMVKKSFFAFCLLPFSKMKHSCVPTLIMTIDSDHGSTNAQEQCRSGYNLSWLALHNLKKGEETVSKIDCLDTDVKSRSVQLKKLMGSEFACSCERCQYENESRCTFTSRQLKWLGDIAMQQGRFKDAECIFDAILQLEPCNGDALHAKAASYLGKASSANFAKLGHCQGYFLRAQQIWNKSMERASFFNHPEISVILKKQNAYGTFPNSDEHEVDLGSKSIKFTSDNYKWSSYLNAKAFLTHDDTPIISKIECQRVIQVAEGYAKKHGWTTSRHYAVPTTDIPLHELSDLQSWFYGVWTKRIRPLLRKQFKLTTARSSSLNRDVFIHDVFVVRYDANGGQRNLPPHYDESTHSFIIALNTDYEGGGTYIYALKNALKPAVAGGMLSFCGGELNHSGDTVVKGTRYIIVAFCYVDLVTDCTKEAVTEHTEKQSGDAMSQSSMRDFSFRFTF